MSQEEFFLLREYARRSLGISLGDLKRPMLERRLAGRLRALSLPSFMAYYRLLTRERPGEGEGLQFAGAVTTGITEFFRHERQFLYLAGVVLPEIRRVRGGLRRVRIWSAGCATGEETYSIAMVVDEAFGEDSPWDIKILATDVDREALKTAFRGEYPASRMEEIPERYRERYFERRHNAQGERVLVRREARRHILFRRRNLADPRSSPATPLDVIFCRNVMIYFDPEIKRRVLGRFCTLLAEGGSLFLGTSENLLGLGLPLTLVGHAIYKKGRDVT